MAANPHRPGEAWVHSLHTRTVASLIVMQIAHRGDGHVILFQPDCDQLPPAPAAPGIPTD